MRTIRTSYEVVTLESARDGDAAERGWVDEEGEPVAVDADDIENNDGDELAALVEQVEKIIGNNVEASSSHFHPGIWYTDTDPSRDYHTGAETRHSYFLDDFTDEEEEAVFRALTGLPAK